MSLQKIIRDHEEKINNYNKTLHHLYIMKENKENKRIKNNYFKLGIDGNSENFQFEYIKCTIKNDSLSFQIKKIVEIINMLNVDIQCELDFIKERKSN